MANSITLVLTTNQTWALGGSSGTGTGNTNLTLTTGNITRNNTTNASVNVIGATSGFTGIGSNILQLVTPAAGFTFTNSDTDGVLQIEAIITGANKTVNIVGPGMVTFAGANGNTYTGATTVSSGELDLSKTAGVTSIAGNLTAGDSVGAANTAIVKLTTSNQIANTSTVTVNSDGQFDIGAQSDTVGPVVLAGGNIAGTTGVLTGSSYDFRSGSASAILGGSGVNLTKSTAGTVILTGANTYTGTTTIAASGGILDAAATNALGGTSSITVNGGGTLLLSNAGTTNRINNSAGMTLSGGTLSLSGVSDGTRAAAGIGALTLTSSSIIDLLSTSLVHFLASNTQTWTGVLSIYNWSGTPVTGGGAEAILFGTNTSGLTAAQLDQISFYSGSGTGFLGTGAWATIGDGEVVPLVPVPEPSTWVAGALALLAIGYTQRRRFQKQPAFATVA